MYAIQPQSNADISSGLVLAGNSGYEIKNDRVVINIAEIANRRDLENISGTLSIELWALEQPYRGADFKGAALAGTRIGEISGQNFLVNCCYDLLFQEPPEGVWYLTLMLREWTDAGYVTRDYVNFSLPYIVSEKPSIVRSETDNVINVSFSDTKKTASATAEKDIAAPEAAKPVPHKPESENAAVSLNNASAADIVAVKGISKKLAENIVAARPFESMEELLSVKGIGPKLLQKIRRFFEL